MARLDEVLSSPISTEYKQVEGFLENKRLKAGKMRKISNIGDVGLNFKCKTCNNVRTYYSDKNLYAIGVNDNTISIDCVLECRCGSSVQMWFLLESENNIHSVSPSVRILKRSEKFSDTAMLIDNNYGEFTEFLDKSKKAARDGLGAGSVVYLRKIFENIIIQAAEAANPPIETKKLNGKYKPFIQILDPVKNQLNIIPSEFSENGYTLFGDLSDIVHGEYDEDEAIQKYSAFYRLVVGVLDNIKNNREIMQAIGTLGWNDGGETDE